MFLMPKFELASFRCKMKHTYYITSIDDAIIYDCFQLACAICSACYKLEKNIAYMIYSESGLNRSRNLNHSEIPIYILLTKPKIISGQYHLSKYRNYHEIIHQQWDQTHKSKSQCLDVLPLNIGTTPAINQMKKYNMKFEQSYSLCYMIIPVIK